MKKKIIIMVEPFDYDVKIYAYEGNKLLDTVDANMDNVNPKTFVEVEKFDASEINIKGPQLYCANVLSKMRTYYETTKYSERNIEIKLI